MTVIHYEIYYCIYFIMHKIYNWPFMIAIFTTVNTYIRWAEVQHGSALNFSGYYKYIGPNQQIASLNTPSSHTSTSLFQFNTRDPIIHLHICNPETVLILRPLIRLLLSSNSILFTSAAPTQCWFSSGGWRSCPQPAPLLSPPETCPWRARRNVSDENIWEI